MGAELTHAAQVLLGFALIAFMAGNLFDMGMKLNLHETALALRNLRFAVTSVAWAFAIGPLFALALTQVFPLAAPFATGLLFLGLAPCAPFMPAMAQKAGCRLGDVAAFMLIASSGMIIFMPLLAPVLVQGFPTSAWAIAKPLLLYIALPVIAGVAVRRSLGQRADALQPPVQKATLGATIVMLVLLVVLHGRDFMNMPGTFSILTLVLFCGSLPMAAYAFGFGLDHSQRSVLALGLSTRNIGAAIAPLYAVPGADPRAIAMCAMAVPVTVVCAAIAARVLGRFEPAIQAG
jgi:BASS family bile acid:Na+ symporter